MSTAAREISEHGGGIATAAMPKTVSDINVMVAGRGGDGSLTIITLLSKLLSQRGFNMCSTRDVASRIKGGHAAAMLRGSLESRWSLGDHLDVVVGFDEQTLIEAAPLLRAGSVVIYDSSHGEPHPDSLPKGVRLFTVPFGRMAVRDLRRELFKNSFSFGVVTRVLNVEDSEAIDVLSAHVKRFGENMAKANIAALREGFEYAGELGLVPGAGLWPIEKAEHHKRLLMTGNQATAFGFLAAGGRFFAGYPITPATDIMDWLRPRLRDFGGALVQAEDELAAINMATGASLAGARAMTATSGPGVALMLEGIGNLGATEIPLVVVDTQRSGPSTGMPTKPEQSDINMLVFGGNGEFPRVVLAPCDQRDAFDIGFQATNLSQRLQCPVMIALDQGIGQNLVTMEPFDLDDLEIDTGKRLTEDELADMEVYKRYEITEDGISPWAVPGTSGGMNLVTGNEHDEWGLVSTQAKNRGRMMNKRARKVELAHDLMPKARRGGVSGASLGIISIGINCGVVREAVERLREQHGIDIEILEPRTIWPVLDETKAFIDSHELTYVVELNHEGQLATLIASQGAARDGMQTIRKVCGKPFRPGQLVSAIVNREYYHD
jgi:2-oxoglutarate ferredoxin oxidoreductase subunit alpha